MNAVATFSHCGNHRDDNQDKICVGDSVFAVADGMGGHRDGLEAATIASSRGVEFATQCLQDGNLSKKTFEKVFSVINDEVRAKYPGSGTTLSLLVIHGKCIWSANVGDSKIFLLRENRAIQLSEDQNFAAASGCNSQKNILLNFIGKSDFRRCHIGCLPHIDSDKFIICTDGLSEAIDIAELTSRVSQLSPLLLSNLIETEAIQADPTDNYSAIIVT